MFRKLHLPEGEAVTIIVDGVELTAASGETIAATILRHPDAWTRQSVISKSRRAPYCMMGVCFECLAQVEGVGSVQTCMKAVCDGMRITRQPLDVETAK